jgi:signal transduction histidine kinase
VQAVTIGTWQERLRSLPERVVDAGAAAAVAVAMTLTISVATEEDASRSPDVLAYLLGLSMAGFLFLRRRWPMGVLIASTGVLMIYYSVDYPAFSPAVPLAAAAYFAASAGQLLPAATLLSGIVLVSASWQTVGEDTSLGTVVGQGLLTDAALMAAVLLLGEAVRNRRAWAEEVRARLRRADEEREREAARRVAEERLRIARELHDVMAHTIAALNVQAGVAADVIDDAPEEARASMRTIREQSREAMTELKAAVGVLRGSDPDAPRAPAPGLAGVDGLVRTASGAGLKVDLAVSGAARPLPGAVDLTAYRIVQESLTNVVRHAGASAATVAIRYEPDAVVVEVDDDGRGPNGAAPGGFGLMGMRERAAAVGGTFHAGPGPGGGFRVSARLPIAEGPA